MQYKGYEIVFAKNGSIFVYNSHTRFVAECENEAEARKVIDVLCSK